MLLKVLNVRIRFLISLIVFLAASTGQAKCLVSRGALEIGSGSTKAFAAVVDTCQKQIQKVLFEKQIQLSFAEAIGQSKAKEIPEEFLKQAVPEIQKLLVEMKTTVKPETMTVKALATAAFREASNGPSAAEQISKKLEIPLNIVTQAEEAELGAVSARSTQKDPNKWFVWDIGGSSMQIIAPTEMKLPLVKGSLASVSFKNKVISDLFRKDPKVVTSPNPLGERARVAAYLAKTVAKIEIPKAFRKAIDESKVLGIGGVLAISVQNQANPGKTEFTVSQVEKALQERAHLTDAELKSSYASTEVTNLALVLGYMQAMGIEAITTVQGNLGPGILLSF